MQGEISIQQVLADLRSEEHAGKVFLLKWVRASKSKNGRKGSIKTVAKCHYGKKAQLASMMTRSKSKVLHIDKGTLPIYDAETGDYLTPLISHIIHFNQFKVLH